MREEQETVFIGWYCNCRYTSGHRKVERVPTYYWLRVSSQLRSTARVLKSRRFVEIALADAGSPFFGGQNGEK